MLYAAAAVAAVPRTSAHQSVEDGLVPSVSPMKHSPMHQDFEPEANSRAALANLTSLPVEFRFCPSRPCPLHMKAKVSPIGCYGSRASEEER